MKLDWDDLVSSRLVEWLENASGEAWLSYKARLGLALGIALSYPMHRVLRPCTVVPV